VIDKLVLRCSFLKEERIKGDWRWIDVHLGSLGVPLEQSIDREGAVFNTRHPWESIPSSYDSMAFKVFDHRYDKLDSFYIEIKASPAKIMQGHNVYGSSDIYDCSMHLIELLCMTYPQVADLLDHNSWFMSQIDLTFSSRASSDREARDFINALSHVSHGQTKSRTGYDGTAYFGKKNSRLKKIKVYSKGPEVDQTIKDNESRKDGHLLNEVYTEQLRAFAFGLIRWEVSLFHRHFERLNISTRLKDIFKQNTFTPEYLQSYWRLAMADIFKAMEGQTMKILNDEDILTALRARYSTLSKRTGKISTSAPDSAFRTFRDIRRDGWEVTKKTLPHNTFYRHINMICRSGVSKAALQNMNGLANGATIIPFVRFIQVDFASQFPDWYQAPPPKHIKQSHLQAIA
jgi:II/X family phage/plasmid replication protein